MAQRYPQEPERRRYIRLDSVFPVEFRLISLLDKQYLSDWLQGFTNNLSKGGICLAVNNLSIELIPILKNPEARLSLRIEIPLGGKSVTAQARVVWLKEQIPGSNNYLIGLSYEEINHLENSKIMRYAWMKKLFVPVLSLLMLILGIGFAFNSLINVKLIQGNKALVGQLVKILQESSIAKQKIKEINKEREDLQLRMQTLQSRIQTIGEERANLKAKVELEETRQTKKIEELNRLIEKLIQEKTTLQEGLMALHSRENNVTEELLRLDKKKISLEKENLDKMYQWLKIHQNLRTGLVRSFEGDKDIENLAFTYDQALVIQAYSYFGDFMRAKKILDFFSQKAKRQEKGFFFTTYKANDGSPVEQEVHTIPNLWMGMAIAQYTQKSKDLSYLNLAEEIAQVIIDAQNPDKEDSQQVGPDTRGESTEYSPCAFAFFNMLYEITQKPEYQEVRDRMLNGLTQLVSNHQDANIAPSVNVWSIMAMGLEKLEGMGMNLDRTIEFIEENFGVEVVYTRPEGETIKIKGFDFLTQRQLKSQGVVSSEWTAKMILIFNLMADFYYKKEMVAKARAYELKANDYLAELGNLVISSSSAQALGRSCLPYATQDVVDTGYGWLTPKGRHSGSVAGTAYTIFAYYDYNPLVLELH